MDEKIKKLIDQYIGYVDQSIAAKEYKEGGRLLIEHIMERVVESKELRQYRNEQMIKICEKYPESWYAQTILGIMHVRSAWFHRGAGYSNTVSKEGFALFRKHMVFARKALEASWDMHPHCPITATEMIRVVGATGSEDDMRMWFQCAVATQFDYHEAYVQYRIYLLPRWGGSHKKIMAFGLECADTERHDTKVPMFLLHAFCGVCDELLKDNKIEKLNTYFADKTLWSRIEPLLQQMATDGTRRVNRLQSKTLYMIHAYKFGDVKRAGALSDEMNGQYQRSLIKHYKMEGVDFSIVQQEPDIDF